MASVPDDATCGGCGYDIRGHDATDRCPECGRHITPRKRTRNPEHLKNPRRQAGQFRHLLGREQRALPWMIGVLVVAATLLVLCIIGDAGWRAIVALSTVTFSTLLSIVVSAMDRADLRRRLEDAEVRSQAQGRG